MTTHAVLEAAVLPLTLTKLRRWSWVPHANYYHLSSFFFRVQLF